MEEKTRSEGDSGLKQVPELHFTLNGCFCFVHIKSVLLNLLCVIIVQELCESRGGRPGLFVLTSLLVSVDVKLY